LNHENLQRGFQELLHAGFSAITDYNFIKHCLNQRFNQRDNYHMWFAYQPGSRLHPSQTKN
jgi:hypothetical protein